MVYIVDKENKPLMPCSEQKARYLLQENMAEPINKKPFAIRLKNIAECDDKATASINIAGKFAEIDVLYGNKVLYHNFVKCIKPELQGVFAFIREFIPIKEYNIGIGGYAITKIKSHTKHDAANNLEIIYNYVIARDAYTCRVCGSQKVIYVHYFFKNLQVPQTLICLCHKCMSMVKDKKMENEKYFFLKEEVVMIERSYKLIIKILLED